MEKLKIPKFENETDEANRAYEHRVELAAEFMNRHSQDTEKRGLRLEAAVAEARETKELVIAPEELDGHSIVSVLRDKLARQ